MNESAPQTGWRDLLAEGRAARLALICLGVWLDAADALVTTTIMPTVGRALGGYALFSWATAAYMTGAVFSGATAGLVAARLGLRTAMIGAALVLVGGCAVSAVAPDMAVLVAGRAVQGLGSGWVLGACYVAIGRTVPERHLARTFALMSGVWGVALVLGPLIGGLFAESGGWRSLFLAFAGQALAFGAAAMALAPKGEAPGASDAPWGQLALVVLGVGLIGAADVAGQPAISTGLGLASLAAFAVAVRLPGAGARLFPRQAGDPRSPIGSTYLALFALTAASVGFSVYAPALLQRLHGLDPLESGYAAALESMGWTLTALAVGGLAGRWHGPTLRLGAVMIAASLALLAMVMRPGPLPAIFAAAALLGAGFGLFSGFASRRVIAAAPDDERELASAAINSVRFVGAAAGACLAGVVANLCGWTNGLSLPAANASAIWLYALAAPVAIVGALAAWRVGAPDVAETG